MKTIYVSWKPCSSTTGFHDSLTIPNMCRWKPRPGYRKPRDPGAACKWRPVSSLKYWHEQRLNAFHDPKKNHSIIQKSLKNYQKSSKIDPKFGSLNSEASEGTQKWTCDGTRRLPLDLRPALGLAMDPDGHGDWSDQWFMWFGSEQIDQSLTVWSEKISVEHQG